MMAPLPFDVTYGQWLAVYNALSFGIAGIGAATIFFWLQVLPVNEQFRTALTITGLVTSIACYQYVRIFSSWDVAFAVAADSDGNFLVSLSGAPFNDDYRCVNVIMATHVWIGVPARWTILHCVKPHLEAAQCFVSRML